jgi:Ca2+/Na+ antiporter
MKKVIYLLPVLLMSCVNFHGTDTSIWSGGMWIFLVLFGAGFVIFSILAYKQSRGGTIEYKENNFQWDLIETDDKIPIYKTPYFYFALIVLLMAIGFIIWQVSEA